MILARPLTWILPLLGFAVLATACSPVKPSRIATPVRVSPTYLGPQEAAYCASPVNFPGETVTVSGRALYTAREVFEILEPEMGQINTRGLGEVGDARPIRYAEVRVINEANEVVQCSETNENGEFGFTLPLGTSSFQVQVNSRANNEHVRVSVLKSPETARFYSLVRTVVPNQNHSLGDLIAHGDDSEVLGGAFNIYDQILNTNIFLRQQVGSCSVTFPDCEDFTTAPKAEIYWERGFNPASYFQSTSTLSFYIPGYGEQGLGRLFILGGVNGNVNSSDTDHFDNSVIIHEYGHFLEDTLSRSDSPGGAHDGDSVIDPRLAWSEGFANFLQAAVSGEAFYVDTFGNTEGSTGFFFSIDLENQTRDVPQFPGEGNFREMAISRLLWDLLDNTPDETLNGAFDNISNGFAELWAVFTRASGFKHSDYAFRSIGLFHQVQHHMENRQEIWTDLRIMESQVLLDHRAELAAVDYRNGFRAEYAYPLVRDGSCEDLEYSIQVKRLISSPPDSGGFATSHLFYNNDFFHYRHSGGPLTLTLNYYSLGPAIANPTTPTGNRCSSKANREASPDVTQECQYPDLNLFLYNSQARFGQSSDIVASNVDMPTYAGTESKSLSVNSLPAGDYLINIMGYTGFLLTGEEGPEARYQLAANGVRLCPK